MKWSLKEFGADAALRYDALLTQTLRDVGDDAERLGVQGLQEIADDVFAYHLRHSREKARTLAGIVRNPRHFLIFRKRRQIIEVLRVLHDARDLRRHVLPK